MTNNAYYVSMEDIKTFMDYVKPEGLMEIYYENGDLEITPTNERDYEKMEQWLFIDGNGYGGGQDIYCDGKYVAIILYDVNDGYGWLLQDGSGREKFGFDSALAAEDDFDKYYEE